MNLKPELLGSHACHLFAALAFCLSSAWATDFYVIPGGAGSRDGASWTNALGDVQAAIDACAASGSGTVKIAAGTYKPTSLPNLVPSGNPAPSPAPPAQFNHFSLRNNVKVWGGYLVGTESRNPQLYPTILSGDLVGNDKDSDGDGFIDTSRMDDNCRVFYHPPWVSVNSTAQLDGVTISEGCGRNNSYSSGGGGLNGGGMFNAANVSPTISNCVFRDNFSEGGNGGAFYKEGPYSNPMPILDRCTFIANKASRGGAVAFSAASSSSAVNSTFVANAATVVGGAVFTSSGSITFTSCTFVNNRAPDMGGGIFTVAPVTNCIFWGNASNSPANPQLTANTVTHSIVQGGFAGTGNMNKDPLLLPLNYYGGNTPTMALRGDSPAINSGSPNAVSVDQRGYQRTPGYDIGAYEYRLNRVLYVKEGGTGDGTSWVNASGNLASMIAAAPVSSSQTTEIWVASGTYTGAIALRSYVSVYGGLSGAETKLSERDIAANPTILSADTLGNDADSDGDGIPDMTTMNDNAPYVCSNSGVLPSAMLDGFVLSGANTAAIRNHGASPSSLSSPTITNCTFRYNAGSSLINDYYSAPRILNCTFHHNAANREVMVNSVNGAPVVVNCTFSGSPSMGSAPIIFNQTQSTAPKYFNCTFSVGAYQTAIINASNTQPTIRSCIIWGNSNTPGIQGGNPIVSHCIIQGNGGADPLLMPLGNYGGPTLTMPIFAHSAAIWLTPEPACGGADAPYADQRGFTRDSKPDIGACEWQQNYAVIHTKAETDLYAIGTRAILNAVSESYDLTQMPEIQWQWYRGLIGDTDNPIDGATQSSFVTPPLTLDASYWVRIASGSPLADAAISLKVYAPHVIHVSMTGNHVNDGSSWALAKPNLQSALENAKSGDHIWVASGTYTNPGPTPITLRSGVSLYGGFSGVETRLDQRNGTATILSADQLGNDIGLVGGGGPDPITTQDNDQVIIAGDMIGSSSLLDGFVFSGATMAAVFNANGSSPTISNCTFRDNPGTSVQNENFSSPAIVNCTFGANPSNSPAPIVVSQMQSSPSITNCTLAVGPTQTAIYDAYGDSNPKVVNSIIWGNIYSNAIQSSSATVSHCVIQNGYSSGTNIIMGDPKLMPMGVYGGITPTMPVSGGSGAINQGQTGAEIPYADQRGFVRDATPDIGACEWQQSYAVIHSGSNANRYAIGSTASLSVVSESELPGTIWQWYRGAVGDTSNPIGGVHQSRYVTDPLTADAAYWVHGWTTQFGPIDVGITLSVYSPHVIHVSANGDDTKDGSTWQLAKRSLQSAVAASQTEGHVWVAAGTYTGTISLSKSVSVYGGFSGMEARLDERDIAAHPTILTADMNGDDTDTNRDGLVDSGTSENAPYVCLYTNVTSSVLDGFILSGANVYAIRNFASSPTIANCTFRFNPGTCVANISSSPVIRNCSFHHNAAEKVVVGNSGSSPSIVNCTFDVNSPTATAPTIMNSQFDVVVSSPAITNCTFVLGATQIALFSSTGYPMIRNCIMWGNTSATAISGSHDAVSNCVMQGGFSQGTSILTQDPKLLPLGNYGGPTPTMPLGSGSSALNTGASGSDIPYADQRGYIRDILPDIGACEFGVAVAALAGDEPTLPGAIGSKPSVTAHTDKANSTYQWFYGTKGDTSQPVPGGASQSLTVLGPLESGVKVWARVTPGDGSAAIDTNERTFEVQGTYDQWCDYHGLNGAERATDASVAGDGIGNLLKFALGLRPRDRGSIGERLATSFDGVTSKLTQEWRISKTPSGLTIILEGSNDLKTWSPVSPVMTGQDAGFETWIASLDASPPAKAAYLRARIIKQ